MAGKIGRPPHEPTQQTRRYVQRMAANAVPHDSIADIIGIHRNTLKKYYMSELNLGLPKANHRVAAALYRAAIKGSVRAQSFWLRCRAGWKPAQIIEHTGADGEPIKIENARDELSKLVDRVKSRQLDSQTKQVKEAAERRVAITNGRNGKSNGRRKTVAKKKESEP